MCGLTVSVCVQFNSWCSFLTCSAVVVEPVLWRSAQPRSPTKAGKCSLRQRRRLRRNCLCRPGSHAQRPMWCWDGEIPTEGPRGSSPRHLRVVQRSNQKNECSHLVRFVETFDPHGDGAAQISDATVDTSADLQLLLYRRSRVV